MFDVTLRCRARRHTGAESYSSQALESQYDEGQEMVCTLIQGALDREWNLWENITLESVGKHLIPILMQQSKEKTVSNNSASGGGKDLQQSENANNKNGPKLSFTPIGTSMSTSRIRATSRLRRPQRRSSIGTSVSTSSTGSLVEYNLPNPLNIGPHKNEFELRHQSPHPRFDASGHGIAGVRTSPSRESSELASACFECYPDDEEQVQLEPFDVLLSDIAFVENDYSHNASIGVVYILTCVTQTNGVVEIIPRSLHARDLLVAFLQAGLSDGLVRDKDTELENQLFVTTIDGSFDFDMQDFEAHAVKKRFANESFIDKMSRRSAVFAARIQELCICCEHISDENDLIYNSTSRSDKDQDNSSTVGSVLTEVSEK